MPVGACHVGHCIRLGVTGSIRALVGEYLHIPFHQHNFYDIHNLRFGGNVVVGDSNVGYCIGCGLVGI